MGSAAFSKPVMWNKQNYKEEIDSLSISLSEHHLNDLILSSILQADLNTCWALEMTFTQNLEKRQNS